MKPFSVTGQVAHPRSVIDEPVVREIVMHVVRIEQGHEHVDVEQGDPAHVLPVVSQVVDLLHRGFARRPDGEVEAEPVSDSGRARRRAPCARVQRPPSPAWTLGGG